MLAASRFRSRRYDPPAHRATVPIHVAVAPTPVRVGWISSNAVKERAQIFDSDLHNFVSEVNANPVFVKRLWKDMPTDQRNAHEAFAAAESSLVYDWSGDDAALKGTPDYYAGYYADLKRRIDSVFSVVGEADLDIVKTYEGRLSNLRAQYKALGYETKIAPLPKPADPSDPVKDTAKAATAIADSFFKIAAVGLGAYVVVNMVRK